MKIKLNSSVKIAGKYHYPGETLECKKDLAQQLIARNVASEVAPAPPAGQDSQDAQK